MTVDDPPARHHARPTSRPSSQRVLHWSAETDAAIEQRVADDPRRRARARRRGGAGVHARASTALTRRIDGRARDRRSAELQRRARRPSRRRSASALRSRRRARAQLPRAPARGLRPQLELPRRRRHAARPEGHAAGPRRHLRAGRQGGLSVERADERDSGAGGRRRRDRHGGADAQGRAQRAGAGRRRAWPACTASSRSAARRRWPRWPTARRPCPRVDKITGPGNAYVASAKRRVFGTGRHRHDRRAERDPGAGRRQHAGRLGGDGPVQPGRARRAGAEHPAVPRRGLHRRGAGGDRAPAADACRAATSSAPRSKAAAR